MRGVRRGRRATAHTLAAYAEPARGGRAAPNVTEEVVQEVRVSEPQAQLMPWSHVAQLMSRDS